MTDRRQTLWLLFALVVAAACLIAVHVMEHMGYAPCELCLKQRVADWTAAGVALAALAVGRAWRPATPIGVVAVGVAFAVGFLVAGYHAGVEWKWWPGPQSCTGRAAGAIHASDMAAVFSGRTPFHMVRCDEAALRVLGLSLAGWNALLSLAMSGVSFALALPRRRL